MVSVAPKTPARGTRPRNRRVITIEAATELFHRLGYGNVSMSDIAKATNVGASALYRHFPGKADLLVAAIRSGLAPYAEVVHDSDEHGEDAQARLASILDRLARVAIEQRKLGVLWQREARNLAPEEQRALREELTTTAGVLSALVLAARPNLDAARADVLAWCTLGALVSISFHSLELPRQQFTALLADIASMICAIDMPENEASEEIASGDTTESESRRDELITVATELFADRGYAATGIDEIGDAVGIAGPSVYSHFANKQAILVAAIQRAGALMVSDSVAILASAEPAPVKLASLVDSYVQLANRDRFVIRTVISEMEQLPAEDRTAARRVQREYIDAWVALLLEFTHTDAVSARIRIQAALLVVNDAVQTPHLRSRVGFERTLARLAKTLLGVPTS